MGQQVDDFFAGRRVGLGRHVREDEGLRDRCAGLFEDFAKRFGGGRDDAGVERVGHRNGACLDAFGGQDVDGFAHGFRRPGDHGLGRAVLVRGDDIAVHSGDEGFGLVRGSGHHGHQAGVSSWRHGVRHFFASGGDDPEGLVEFQHAGRHTGAVLTQGMAGHGGGSDAESLQDAQERHVRGKHGGLGHCGLLERLFRRRFRLVRILFDVAEGVVAEFASQHRLHDAVRLVERIPYDLVVGVQVGEHANILAALSREEEPHGLGIALTEIGPCPCQLELAFAGCDGLFNLFQASGEFVLVRGRDAEAMLVVVDGLAVPIGCLRHGHAAFELFAQGSHLLHERLLVGCCQPDEGSLACDQGWFAVVVRCFVMLSDRSLGLSRTRRCRSGRPGCRSGALARAMAEYREICGALFEHHVEVRPTEAEGAHTGATRAAVRLPLFEFFLDPEGEGPRLERFGDGWVGDLVVRGREQDLLFQGQDGFD